MLDGLTKIELLICYGAFALVVISLIAFLVFGINWSEL